MSKKGLMLFKKKGFNKKIILISTYKALTGYLVICIPLVFAFSEIAIAKALNRSKSHPPHAPKIISIQPEEGEQGFKVHIIADGKIKNFKSFRLFKPHRLVVDMPGVQSSVWYSTLFFESSLVKSIRLGSSYKKMVRVVFDLSPAKNLRYKVYSKGKHLIVDFGAKASSPIVDRAQKVRQAQSRTTPVVRKKAAPGSMNSKSPNPAGKILSVKLEEEDTDTKVHFVGDVKLTRYKYFHLFNPPRFVIDLLDVQSSVSQTSWPLNNPLVKKIRLGTSYKDKVRVVFDLVRDTKLPYKFFSKDNHLTLAFGVGYKVPSFKSTQQVKMTPQTITQAKEEIPVTKQSKITSPRSAITITSIDLKKDDQSTRLHIAGDGKFTLYDAYHLSDPPRFVIDLPDANSSVSQKSWPLNNPLVREIRLGTSYKDKVRVVFDLSRKTRLPYKIFTKGNHFIIAFETGSPVAAFEHTPKVQQAPDSSSNKTIEKAPSTFSQIKPEQEKEERPSKESIVSTKEDEVVSTSIESMLPEGLKMEDRFKSGFGAPVGRVVLAQGKVVIMHAGVLRGYWAKKDLPLFKGDIIITQANGGISFKLYDKSMMTLAPRTKLVINKSVYNQVKKSRFSFLKMKIGRARFLVTKLFGSGRSNFRVKTPTAIIGVRGSDFIVRATPKITEVTALEKTQVEVVSSAFPGAKPMVITDFARTTVAKGTPPSEMVMVAPEEIVQLKKEFSVAPKTVERGVKVEGQEGKSGKKESGKDKVKGNKKGGGEGRGEEGKESEGDGDQGEEGSGEEGEDNKGGEEEKEEDREGEESGEVEGENESSSEGSGGEESGGGASVFGAGGSVASAAESGVASGSMVEEGTIEENVIGEPAIFIADDDLVNPEGLAELEQLEEPISMEIVEVEEISSNEEAVVEQQQQVSEEQHEETLATEQTEEVIQELPPFPGGP